VHEPYTKAAQVAHVVSEGSQIEIELATTCDDLANARLERDALRSQHTALSAQLAALELRGAQEVAALEEKISAGEAAASAASLEHDLMARASTEANEILEAASVKAEAEAKAREAVLAGEVASLTHSLTHPLTHTLTHSRTHSLTHSLHPSPTHSLTHTPTHSLTHSLTHTLTPSLTHPLTHTPAH